LLVAMTYDGTIGMLLGHEITGEITEVGRDVKNSLKDNIVSVPFNGVYRRCKTRQIKDAHICLNVNHEGPGGS